MALSVDIAVAEDGWRAAVPGLDALVRRAVDAAATGAGGALPEGAEVSVLLADDATVRILNRDWRGVDKATNVLSFPADAPGGGPGPVLLGDVALAFETVRREAAGEGKALDAHLAHLLVHGVLHLLHHDHDTDEAAGAMEALEARVLGSLGLPDPYAGSEPVRAPAP